MLSMIDKQIQGVLTDSLGRRARVRRKGRAQAWRGVLGYHKDDTSYALRDGNIVLVTFTLGEVMPPFTATTDGMEITLVP